MQVKKGTTRITILLGRLAFKLPIFSRSLKHFAKGWLGNIDENNTWKTLHHKKLCPVHFSFFGLINVMTRVSPIVNKPFNKQEILKYFEEVEIDLDVCSGWKNFGLIDSKLVVSDYAVCRESSDECSDCDDDCILKKI